jgi:multidrug efflux pump subunit AcrB
MVDLHSEALYAKGLSAIDVSNALGTQNVILPAGTAKMGPTEYVVRTNSSPDAFETLNDIPVREDGPATVYLSDVAQVHDGFAIQTSMVHVDGQRSALLTVMKTADASTLDIVQRVRDALPRIKTTLPSDLEVTPLFDQSVFVRAALNGVFVEATIAAVLTGLMILLFLGSWRSTLVIIVSIPLSILVSIIVFSSMGQTLNTMTLGGLALAVGILVDDATVEIENVNRNFGMGKPITRAILDGAQQIAAPAFVSTLCICIVFVPVVFITGVAKYLFMPLALAVVLAMLASYFLSRTVVPTMVHYLLPAEAHLHQEGRAVDGGWIWAVHQRFNHPSPVSRPSIGARSPGRWITPRSSSRHSRRWWCCRC